MAQSKKARTLSSMIKSFTKGKSKLDELKSSTSGQLSQLDSLLDLCLKTSAMIGTLEKQIHECTWKNLFKEFERIQQVGNICAKRLEASLLTIVQLVSEEIKASFESVATEAKELNGSSSESTVRMLIDKISSQVDRNETKDRLGETPDNFFGAIVEPESDFVYLARSRIVSLRALFVKCKDKMHTLAESLVARIEKAEAMNAVELFQTEMEQGALFKASLILADLVALWQHEHVNVNSVDPNAGLHFIFLLTYIYITKFTR